MNQLDNNTVGLLHRITSVALPEAGYAVAAAPHAPDLTVCTTAANFGIRGPGALHLIEFRASSAETRIVNNAVHSDALFDVAWSPDGLALVAAAGDGRVLLWRLESTGRRLSSATPAAILTPHSREVHSIAWCADQLLTASWDASLCLTDASSGSETVRLRGHQGLVYRAVFCSQMSAITVASCGGDCTLRVWDTRRPYMPSFVAPDHGGEVLSCDWLSESNLLACGDVTGCITIWDWRNARSPQLRLRGHDSAVRSVRWLSQKSSVATSCLVSCGYDMTTRLWQVPLSGNSHAAGDGVQLACSRLHSEFVYGLSDVPGQPVFMDCAWDRQLLMYQVP